MKKNYNNFFEINFSPDKFAKVEIINKVSRDILKRLNQICDNFTIIKDLSKDVHTYRKFIDYCSGQKVVFTKFDIKKLCFFLDYYENEPPYNVKIINDTEKFVKAFNLIKENFKYSMIVPLCLLHLSHYDNYNHSLSNFIKIKIELYEGRNKIINTIKSFKDYFFVVDGYKKYTDENFDKPIENVFSKIDLPDFFYNTKFFSLLIIYYVEQITNENKELTLEKCESIVNVLEINNSSDTRKILCSIIIKYLGLDVSLEIKKFFRNYVFEKIGDPINDVNWTISDSSFQKYQSIVFDAKHIFKQWITIDAINLFFDRLTSLIDPIGYRYRKEFWKRLVPYMNFFKIILPLDKLSNFWKDHDFEQIFKDRWAIYNTRDDNQCAFLFCIQNHIFVEFARTGSALYVYDVQSKDCPNTALLSYKNKDLKTKRFIRQYLVSGKTFNNEGRLLHVNSEENLWQKKLESWFRIKLQIKILLNK